MSLGVIHVVDPLGAGLLGRGAASDAAVLACADAVRARPRDAHGVVVIGTRAAAGHALGLGLRAHAIVAAPLGHAGLSARALRRAVRALGGADVLQPWSARARAACRLAGLGEGAVAPTPAGLWPRLDGAADGDRARLRAALGVDASTRLVALLADPARHADARRFVYMIGLLDVAGIAVAGLVDRRSAHLARAKRFHAQTGVGWRLLVPREPVGRLLPACDLAVVVPPEVAAPLSRDERAWVSWSVLRAHLLGVPVVGGGGWLPEAASPGARAGLLRARSESVTDIGRQLAGIAGEPGRLGELSDAVREAAGRFATREPFADGLGRLWSGVERFEDGGALALEG